MNGSASIRAMVALGQGLLDNARNDRLRARLRSGDLSVEGFYAALIRLVYRIVLVFVAADRGRRWCSIARELRRRALRTSSRTGEENGLWSRLRRVVAEGGRTTVQGRQPPAFDPLECELADAAIVEAVAAMVFRKQDGIDEPFDFRELTAEQVGHLYETLLEVRPELDAAQRTFHLRGGDGTKRKKGGVYYTPPELTSCLLDMALEPVIRAALQHSRVSGVDPDEALLSIRICDPACGAGHFLVPAARRIAERLCAVRGDTGSSALRRALGEVVRRSIYGVDLDPVAVEVCRAALELETDEEPGSSESVARHIRWGNSLLGATPALIAAGIPDAAFHPLPSDDREVAASLRRRNGRDADRFPIARLFDGQSGALAADAWCAAFVASKTPNASALIWNETLRRILRDPASVPDATLAEIERLSREYHFFHWHLSFPEVFRPPESDSRAEAASGAGWYGGFDAVLGNPPWEKLTTLEREFFSHIPEITGEKRSDRRKTRIRELRATAPSLYESWLAQQRRDQAVVHLLRRSGLYPRSAVGELNLYPLFVELSERLRKRAGCSALIVKTGMLLSPTWAGFTGDLLDRNLVDTAFDFRNWSGWFPAIGYHERFTLLSLRGARRRRDFALGYYLDHPREVRGSDKVFRITRDEIRLLNPHSRTPPALESRRDKDILVAVYRRLPVLADARSGWNLRYSSGLHLASRARMLRDLEELTSQGYERGPFQNLRRGEEMYVPLCEGKLIHQFDHRFASYSNTPRSRRFGIKAATRAPSEDAKRDPWYATLPRYWISSREAAMDHERRGLKDEWAVTFRDTTNVLSNFRTAVSCIHGGVAFSYKSPNLVLEEESPRERAVSSLLFITLMNSFAFDYVLRQKFYGANLIKSMLLQVAVPGKNALLSERGFLVPRALELTYTSHQLDGLARDAGFSGPPFRWDEKRRFLLRCELDAKLFQLYGFDTDTASHILEKFPIVRKKDAERYGEYRTRRVILDLLRT